MSYCGSRLSGRRSPSYSRSRQDPSRIRIEWIAKDYAYRRVPHGPGTASWSSAIPRRPHPEMASGRAPGVFRDGAGGPGRQRVRRPGPPLHLRDPRAARDPHGAGTASIEVLAEQWEGKRLNAPNDLAVSRNGHVYFTDPAFGEQADRRELDFYGVYHIPPKGPLKLVAKPAGRPNGIALSPNGRMLYVTNADEHNVRAYDLDRDGDASERARAGVRNRGRAAAESAVDEKGNLYVAASGDRDIQPRGQAAPHHRDGTTAPSNCAFGDADGKTLFVTAGGGTVRVLRGSPGSQLMRGAI